ncbi:PLDc N-terminal domain-containing protein [bacterium]|nr:PLDc N-terminal domain-containing protein [bacterium]
MHAFFQSGTWIITFILASWLFWMWMLLECVIKELVTGREKLGWTVLITSTYILGALLYFLFRRTRRISEIGE